MIELSIADIANELYAPKPAATLFHYTTIGALLGIVLERSLYATDVRYFNDYSEKGYTATLIALGIHQRAPHLSDDETRILSQLKDWADHRLSRGYMQFVTCFTMNGNLLSQWRGYSKPNKGISLGFDANALLDCASTQSFELVKCVYSHKDHVRVAERFIDELLLLAVNRGENTDRSKRHPDNSYYDVFEDIESDMLRIAVALKSAGFAEEEEWRAVSKIVKNYVAAPIEYREGESTLLPYIRFGLPTSLERLVDMERIYVGPTPRSENSIQSVSNFLSREKCHPRLGVIDCGIPYRVW